MNDERDWQMALMIVNDCISIVECIVMDTEEDRATHARVVATMRQAAVRFAERTPELPQETLQGTKDATGAFPWTPVPSETGEAR